MLDKLKETDEGATAFKRDLEEVSKPDVKAVFASFDDNGDGVISREELNRVLSLLGADAAFIDFIFSEMDVNKDGKVSYDEFCDWAFGSAKKDLPADVYAACFATVP